VRMHRIGTAGWSLPKGSVGEGSCLERYSRVLCCTEINSSFYRVHRASTWARWAAETPEDFRFSIKAAKTITHEAKLRGAEPLLRAFLEQIQPMEGKAGPLLFQLPPSLAFDRSVAEEFLGTLRALYPGEAVLEPRHASWFTPQAEELLREQRIARVAADPAKGTPGIAERIPSPGGDTSVSYFRLHGSPRVYYSSYGEDFLSALAARMSGYANCWIIFDNTVLSHAFENAVRLRELVGDSSSERRRAEAG
jgi:uncharacterized protein YecE (DUF72 family)